MITVLKFVAVMIAAGIVGNSFLGKNRQARREGQSWYQPYLSLPGLMVVVAILLPVLVWWLRR
jgi:hypothetical protein